jgi:hypothetical protein
MTTKRHTSTYSWRPVTLPHEIDALIDRPRTFPDRGAAHATPEQREVCWLWQGTMRNGYPVLRVKVPGQTGTTRPVSAHRFVYEVVLDERIPGRIDGDVAELDHRCRTPQCVNPWHMEPVSKSTNLSRRVFGGAR